MYTKLKRSREVFLNPSYYVKDLLQMEVHWWSGGKVLLKPKTFNPYDGRHSNAATASSRLTFCSSLTSASNDNSCEDD